MVEANIGADPRKCLECREIKPADEFFNDNRRQNGKRSRCKTCTKAENGARRGANHEKYLAIEKVSKTKSRAPRTKQTRGMWRRWQLKSRFGMTVAQFDAMLAAQRHACAICCYPVVVGGAGHGRRETACLDHDHGTGKVRGILCNWCNVGLGRFSDNEDHLEKAAAYLKGYR